jgi:spermidine synthase
VLETLLDAFSSLSGDNWACDMFWELTMHSIPPTEDMKKSPWQPFAIVVKSKEKPANNEAALIDIRLDFTINGRKVAETEQIVQVRQVVEEWKERAKKRHAEMKKTREQARRVERSLSGLQAGQRVLVNLPADIQVGVEKLAPTHNGNGNGSGDLVRFKAAVVDVEKEVLGKMKMICAVFLVPQGREHEWLFSTEEGQKGLLEGCNVSRLIIISLVREQSYGTMDEIQAELSPLVLQLAPLSCRDGDVKIQYLTIGEGIGKRETVHKCQSDLNGPVVVEDVTLQEEGKPQTFRRMVFLESSDLIQSEALLHSNSNSKSNNNKQKMKKKNEEGVQVDHSYLPCNYHLAVSAGMSFAGLRKRNKKEPVRVLLVGLGGGGLPMFLSKQFPSDVTVIELDPVVERLAKDHFGFCETDQLRSIVGDGIKYIRDCPLAGGEDSLKYDMIVVDASGSSSESISCPPKEFLQVTFLKELSNILAESGILSVNVVTRSNSAFENAMGNLKSVFGNLFCIQAEEDINRVVLGFKGAESLRLDSLKKNAVDHLRKVQRSKAHQKDLSDAILNDLMKIE